MNYLHQWNQLYKEMDSAYRKAAAASGLSECTLWILYFLCASDEPVTQRYLCSFMLQSKQSVNSALKKMEADGWVQLTADPSDGRSRLIHLTDAGKAVADQTAARIIRAEEASFRCFAEGEPETYLSLMRRHTEALTSSFDQLFQGDHA